MNTAGWSTVQHSVAIVQPRQYQTASQARVSASSGVSRLRMCRMAWHGSCMPLPPMSRDGRTTDDDPAPRRGPSSRPPPADRHQRRTRRHGRHGSQLTGRADDQGLRLVWVELQAVLHVPLSDVSGTSGENGETLGIVVCVHGQSHT